MHQPAMPIGGYHAKSFLHRVSPPSSTRSNRRLGAACQACRPASFGEITLETSALPPRAPPSSENNRSRRFAHQTVPTGGEEPPQHYGPSMRPLRSVLPGSNPVIFLSL